MGVYAETKEELKRLWDSYKSKRATWQNRENKLRNAYNEIKKIKDSHKAADKKLSAVLKGTSWKGKTRTAFEKMLDSVENAVDKHYDKIDAIQDGINKEANKAADQYAYFGRLVRDAKTAWDNWTN